MILGKLAPPILILVALATSASPVLAQEAEAEVPSTLEQARPEGPLRFQLNNAETVEGSCQLSFVVQNDTGSVISQSSYSMTVVNAEGRVATLITFQFGSFPQGRPKVQQFALPDLACEDLSAISINEYGECVTDEAAADSVCEEALRPSSLTDIEFPWSF
jgi:hypothetical protein